MPASHPNLMWGGVQVPKPFLTIPHARHTPQPYTVTEGWSYAAERSIHGLDCQKAVDLLCVRDEPIYMPADGWVARTYQSWLTEITYRGKRLGYGLGMWLLTLHALPDQPEVFWWTKIAHLSWIDPTIYYLRPTQDGDGDWHEPDALYVPDSQLAQIFSYRKRGDLVATAGDTGIEWGYRDDFNPVTGQVVPRTSFPSWDLDLHIHFEVYRRKNGSEVGTLDAERICIDPFGLYGQVRADAPLYKTGALGPGHVFLTNAQGQLLHATDLSE